MTDKDTARQKIAALVEKFRANESHYKSPQFNEAELRRQFVDVFFEALGWDIHDLAGKLDVGVELYLQVEEGGKKKPKRPDYGFQINGQTRFFVETKKPSVNLKADPEPAFQLRRYGWSGKLPISILTDFEEFIVYDCRTQPDQNDKAHTGRLEYYKYTEYLEKWDEIFDLFSYEAVSSGKLDEWTQQNKPRGILTVDDAFLKEMEEWRALLAKDIALLNRDRDPQLTQRELNMAVQTTIDRIVFLRICEDRGVEPYGRLGDFVRGKNVYQSLLQLFRQADTRFNSGLFHFAEEPGRDQPDTLTPTLAMGDDTLQNIISRLYYPISPYEFSVLPADILGQVYERFLGKVIELTPGGGAQVVEKPEVRKAGGVYYTPTYIVDYIVQHTVGKLVEGKKPDDVAKLTILDPACGSGSFLIGAFQYLINWHLQWYIDDGASKHLKAKRLRQQGEFYTLTTDEKKRILLNNLYGVDLDQQAVEVTKLSLLLKVLEGETATTTTSQPGFAFERVLPDLDDNIKWGNSLIGSDYFVGKQIAMFDDEATYKVKVFDWGSPSEGFGRIIGNGGFDVVIGNPPWGAEFTDSERSYLVPQYSLVPTKTKDSYFFFISKAINLLRDRGILGFIIPNTWLLINNAKEYRQELLSWKIREIIDYGDGVFRGVTAESSVVIIEKLKDNLHQTRAVRLRRGELVTDHLVSKNIWLQDNYSRIIIDLTTGKSDLQKRLRETYSQFEEEGVIKWGIKPYQVGYGVPPQTQEVQDNRIYHSTKPENSEWKPLLVGSNVDRYKLQFPGNQYIRYGQWLMYPSDEKLILQPKILLRQTSDKLRACLDANEYYPQNSIFIVHSETINLTYLLGLLNSRLLGFVYQLGNPQVGKTFAEIKPSVIKELPIRTINFDDPNDKRLHDRMVEFVTIMLDLHQQVAAATSPQIQKTIQGVIDQTDRQIDALVYELYGLTEAEIRIVEGT